MSMSSPTPKKKVIFAPAKENSEEIKEGQKAIPAKMDQATTWALKTWQAWATQHPTQ